MVEHCGVDVGAEEVAAKALPAKAEPSAPQQHGRPASGLQAFNNDLPTSQWRDRLDERDACFTVEAIDAAEAKLRRFLGEVEAAGSNRTKLKAAIRRSVKAFDSLNQQHGSFVETMEREELAAFYNAVADEVGLEYDGDDITEQWRRNW